MECHEKSSSSCPSSVPLVVGRFEKARLTDRLYRQDSLERSQQGGDVPSTAAPGQAVLDHLPVHLIVGVFEFLPARHVLVHLSRVSKSCYRASCGSALSRRWVDVLANAQQVANALEVSQEQRNAPLEISRAALHMLTTMNNPPEAVRMVLESCHCLLYSEPPSQSKSERHRKVDWLTIAKGAKGWTSGKEYVHLLLNIDLLGVSKEQADTLALQLGNTQLECPAYLSTMPRVCVCLCAWLHGVNNVLRVRYGEFQQRLSADFGKLQVWVSSSAEAHRELVALTGMLSARSNSNPRLSGEWITSTTATKSACQPQHVS